MLAIVIPYYKRTYFEETLSSLARQTDKRFQVYIGDDASPEDCTDLLDKFRGMFAFSYHRFEENLGGSSLARQWERCISLSGNEAWLMILGDDDYLSDNVVASFYEHQAEFSGKTQVVRFATKKVFDRWVQPDVYISHPVWESATAAFYRKFDKTSRSSLSEYFFSRKSYVKYGFHDYPLAWTSDDKAWLDFSDGLPIYTINESNVFFRLSPINVSGRKDNLQLKNQSEIAFYKFIIDNKLGAYNGLQRLHLVRRYHYELGMFKQLSVKDRLELFRYYAVNFHPGWVILVLKKLGRKLLKKKKP